MGLSVTNLKRVDDNNNNMKSLEANDTSFDLNTSPSRIFINETKTDILNHKHVSVYFKLNVLLKSKIFSNYTVNHNLELDTAASECSSAFSCVYD